MVLAMEWERLTSPEELDALLERSIEVPQLIFKHSSRCSLSSMAFNRLQTDLPNVGQYFLDIIKYRELSNLIAQKFEITHQSPQILIIHNQRCIFDTSHFNISSSVINEEINLIHKV